jgi:hypothetical protein
MVVAYISAHKLVLYVVLEPYDCPRAEDRKVCDGSEQFANHRIWTRASVKAPD